MIHFTTLPTMQQSATKQQPAAICQNVSLQRKAWFSEGARMLFLYLWQRDAFQAQLLDTNTAETMTVLEQSSQGEVSMYCSSGQQDAGKMIPSRSLLMIYKLNKRISY